METKIEKRQLRPSHLFCFFWLQYLGYNFRRASDGAILTKGMLWDSPLDDELYYLVPYSPLGGWLSSEEANEHKTKVTEIREFNGIKDISADQLSTWGGAPSLNQVDFSAEENEMITN